MVTMHVLLHSNKQILYVNNNFVCCWHYEMNYEVGIHATGNLNGWSLYGEATTNGNCMNLACLCGTILRILLMPVLRLSPLLHDCDLEGQGQFPLKLGRVRDLAFVTLYQYLLLDWSPRIKDSSLHVCFDLIVILCPPMTGVFWIGPGALYVTGGTGCGSTRGPRIIIWLYFLALV